MEKPQTPGRRSKPASMFVATRVCAGLLLALAACAGDRSRGTAGSSAAEAGVAAYSPAEDDAVRTRQHSWPLSGGTVKVLLSVPARPRSLPLVIYVPGLGESNGAGERWRRAWSVAGYAVMSVQPLPEDEAAWTSELARTGEFKALAREHYSVSATRRRVRALEAIADEARRRSRAGEEGWDRIDWERVAIAGFDLGAYTALAFARDHEHAAEAAAPQLRLRAALALSPYASVSTPERDAPGGAGLLPLLAVTSDADGDPLGVVAAGERSDRPFDRMQGPDDYLLLMGGLTHASLSGSAAAERPAEDRASAGLPAADSSPSGDSGGRQSRARHGPAGGPTAVAKNHRASTGGSSDIGLSPADTRARMEEAQRVSTAFLDAYLNGDARALDWLAATASRWLGPTGALRRQRTPGASG
jgi:dienelactone hydrolase